MAPVRVKDPPTGVDWLHEVKFDCWRVQLRVDATHRNRWECFVTETMLDNKMPSVLPSAGGFLFSDQ